MKEITFEFPDDIDQTKKEILVDRMNFVTNNKFGITMCGDNHFTIMFSNNECNENLVATGIAIGGVLFNPDRI